jgi:hypothetical protein
LEIKSLILEFAQALGGISKHKRDFWILEVPMAGGGTVTVFIRLNRDEDHGAVLVFFTQIGCLPVTETDPARYRRYLEINKDLLYSRIALLGERVVILAVAGETFDEDIMLEMIHEVVYAGARLGKESTEQCG